MKEPTRVRVKNCDNGIEQYKYTIIRDNQEGFYWYYGAGNDLFKCSMIAREIRNGLVVETSQVDRISMMDK